jgi:CheY-like chemotaxis protein/CBS domain-containing protein
MKIADLMNADLAFIDADASVREAAELMAELDLGALPVGGPDNLKGIVTQKDLMIRVLARGRDAATPVHAVMSAWVHVCAADEAPEPVIAEMRRRGVHRMPVIDDRRHVVGMIELAALLHAGGGAPTPAPPPASPPGERRRSAGRVLLVEDDADIREVLKAMLVNAGYAVTGVATRAEAVIVLGQGALDLAVIDVRLPDGSGIELARAVREAGHASLVITGDGNEMQRLELHGQPYLGKPFRAAELLQRVAALARPAVPPQAPLAAAGAKPGDGPPRKKWPWFGWRHR